MTNTKIISFLRTEIPEIQLIYIFGSESKGTVYPDSDLDIAILANKRVDSIKLWDVRLELSNILERDVDLIDLKTANDILKMEIIYHGICIYKTDEDTRQFFESRVIEDYIDLKELIKPQEDEIRKTGKIY